MELTCTFLIDRGIRERKSSVCDTLFIVAPDQIIKTINLQGLIINKSE